MQVNDDMVRAAAEVFCENGIHIALPQDGDLDDLERERYDTLRAALNAALAHMWLDMDSAPKDGRHVMLGMADDGYVGQGYYDADSGNWYPPLQNSHEWPDMKMHPTHFMLLPAPPKTGGE